MLDKAIRIAAVAFEGKFDKGGQPYILHCLQVMNDTWTDDIEVKCAAVLHDLFEDLPDEWNEQRLFSEGISWKTCQLVRILTHDSATSYEDYIKLIGHFTKAVPIKLADLRHNSQITRLKDVRKKRLRSHAEVCACV